MPQNRTPLYSRVGKTTLNQESKKQEESSKNSENLSNNKYTNNSK